MGNIFRYETLDSTNAQAILLARQNAAEEAVVTARRQTGGKGRQGKRFESPEGGLYLSVLTSKLAPGEQIYALTPAAALAARCAVLRTFGLDCRIKYPNDLILEGRKVCGILCESLSLPDRFAVVIGIGINVQADIVLPEEDPAPDYPPGALKDFCGKSTEPEALQELEAALIEELNALIGSFAAGGSLDEAGYRSHCLNCPDTIIQF